MSGALVGTLALPAAGQAHPPVAGQESLGAPDLPGQEVLSGDLYLDKAFTYDRTRADVVYGGNYDHHGRWVDLLLDVYEPAGQDEEFRPAIITVHGGGFANGSKDEVMVEQSLYAWQGALLARRGYVVVPINYRLRPDRFTGGGVTSYTQQMETLIREVPEAARWATEDAKAAVRWVRAHAAELRIDPGRIAVVGGSAGGFVAMGLAFDSEEPGGSGSPGPPNHVAAAVAMTGAYGPGMTGGPILPGSPPISFHNAINDFEVPIVGTAVPCLNTRAMGNVCEPYVYPYESGTWQYWHALRRHQELVAARTASFLYRHMISVERTETEFVDVAAEPAGAEAARVRGRLVTDGGRPVSGDRVLARSETGGWAETTTGMDGAFSVEVDVPGHDGSSEVTIRYEGRSSASWLLADPYAPTSASTTVTWDDPEPVATAFTGLQTLTLGDRVTVTGRLLTDDGSPVTGAPVSVRPRDDEPVTATTDGNGRFTATLHVPDHGRALEITVAYAGDANHLPAQATTTATWGALCPAGANAPWCR